MHVGGQARTIPPAPWTNVVAHETFGFACTESGPGLHLVRQQPRQPADAVAQRSGLRSARRSGVHPRRDSRRVLVRDAAAGRRRAAATSCVTARATRPTSTPATSVASELTLFVPRERAGEGLPPGAEEHRRARPRRLSVTLYAEWVLGENRSRTAIHVVTGIEPATGAVTATNRFRQEFPDRVGVPGSVGRGIRTGSRADDADVTGDRTEFIGRNGSLRRPAALGRDALSNRVGAGARPVRRDSRRTSTSARARSGSSSACSATPPTPAQVARARRALSRSRRGRRRAARGRARSGTACSARSTVRTPDRGDGPAAQSLAALPDAGLPHLGALGVLPVERRVRLPRPAAGHAGAAGVGAGDRRARTCFTPRRGSSSKGTSSTGGTSRAARACAPASRTTGSGCRTRRCTTSGATGDDAVLDEQVPFLAGRVLEPGRARGLRAADGLARDRRRSTSTASGRSRSAWRPAPTACR